ncbi:hypothetical protein [Yersinia ruckeri]|uniref:hypothetical protein n=1 Tax=Yersinia ruckeri TaxID=29486 RepID=UPI002238D425|nr:hypothetical protein [Yersinia ruckeri]MCW6598699.1 hypothetical protein [Yersinia ruckeri]
MLNHTNAQVELFRTAQTAGLPITDSVFVKRARLADGAQGVDIATGDPKETVVGIAHIRAVAQRFGTVVKQQHVVQSDVSFILPKMPVAGTVKVFNVTKNAPVDESKLTWTGATAKAADETEIAKGDVVEVTYRYAMSMLEVQSQGLPIDFANQITGNDGAVEIATGRIKVEIDNFDTNAEYEVDADIYVAADGSPTTVKNGKAVAKVVSEPTAANPVLAISAFFVY